MKKYFTLSFFLLMICFYASAQKASIKGVITDTSSKQNLSNTTISLLHAKDSILYKFTRSNAQGSFALKNLDSGKYVLLISYPQYADFVDELSVTDTSKIDLGKISMILKANLLQDVIVRTGAAIRIKGDTTEFAADSFKVQPNATVEDLLKKLPGIQIDKNGNITAQGEKVQKVLVDGEEFFGDDPTLVTQNLRADMVDKVQLYDKKSDQAAFTGIDDGQKEKTINLKLKDNKKNGYFGKANLSAGTNGYHDSQLMFNDFKGKRKLAFYGIVSNTGTSGLNWQDQNNYGDNPFANADVSSDGNGISIFIDNDDELSSWDGRYNGQGIPLVQTGGLHYNNKWDDDKQSLNANYKALQLHVNGESSTRSEFILPDTLYFNNDKQSFHNQILRNRLNGAYEFQFDTSSSLKITADGGIDHKITNLTDSSEARASDSSLVNNALRRASTTGDNKTLNSNLLWRKKFKKKGRTISFNLRETYTNNTSTGFLYSNNNYYLNGVLAKDSLTDQYKTNNTESISFNSKLTYTEPLSKVSSLVFNYGVNVSNSKAVVNSYNKLNEKYSALDSLYSNHYLFNILTNRGGISYSLFQKKFKLNFGSDVGYSAFHQTNKFNNSIITRNFTNWYPQANASYQFTRQRRLSFYYNGSTQQPDINQIQPVKTNIDPLNITIGNPLLKPAFQNYMRLNFFDYKVLTDQDIYIGINTNFTENNITNKSYVDSFGRTINQYVNLNGNRSVGGNLGYGFKLKKLDMHIRGFSDINMSRYANIVNNLSNVTKSSSYTFGIGFYKDKEKKFSIDLNPSVTYTTSTSSIQQNIKTNYWSFDADPNIHVYFGNKGKYQIQTDCDFNFKQKTSVFDNNNNVIFWNAWIGRTFLKKDALLVKIIGHDLLDQNIGFNRTVNSNFISENTYSTIKRYFLLSVVWNFNKAGTKAPGENE